jgi:hypothetical protein
MSIYNFCKKYDIQENNQRAGTVNLLNRGYAGNDLLKAKHLLRKCRNTTPRGKFYNRLLDMKHSKIID